MLKRKSLWILSSITFLLLLAVFVVKFYDLTKEREIADFLPVRQSEKTEALNRKTMAIENLQLEELQQVSLENQFSESYNRKLAQSDIEEIMKNESKISEEAAVIQTSVSTEEIPFATLEYVGDWLAPGERLITLSGVNGQEKIIYKEIYDDGILVDKIEISREVIVDAIRQEIAVGPENTADDVAEITPQPTATNPAQTQATSLNPPQTQATATNPPSQDTDSQSIEFVKPGPVSAAGSNYNLIAHMMKTNGNANYYNYTDNGNNTITVDGVLLAYDYKTTSTITGYDGQEANNGYNKTSTGLRDRKSVV